jgi:CubicO group peptidase (beta-lactamase class C family)
MAWCSAFQEAVVAAMSRLIDRRAFVAGGWFMVEECANGNVSRVELQFERRDRRSLDELASSFMERNRIPALEIAVGIRGRVLLQRAYGFADLNLGTRLGTGNLMRTASVSKPITSAAIFTLVQEGRLSLISPVFGESGVLPADSVALKQEFLSEVTIDHLLTHTAGGWGSVPEDPMFQEPQLSNPDFIRYVLETFKLTARPGLVFLYSNFGYFLLGRIIEQVTSRSYSEYVREAILSKCAIRDMTVARNHRLPHEVLYYGCQGEDPYSFNITRMDADGGWLATASDLAKFGSSMMGPFRNVNIINKKYLSMMLSPTTVRQDYARGWAIDGQEGWLHGGSLPGTSSVLYVDRSGLTFAGLCNSGVPGNATDIELIRLFRDILKLGLIRCHEADR